jgi:AraC-like DNA-binding protein
MDPSRPFLHAVAAPRPKDDQVNQAIDAIQAAPTRRWTVFSLARVAGLSRAAFARRFARIKGVPPLRWLTEHRMELARARLLESDEPLAVIAGDVGYTCELRSRKRSSELSALLRAPSAASHAACPPPPRASALRLERTAKNAASCAYLPLRHA